MKMKVAILSIAALALVSHGAPAPNADPEAFFPLGAIAIPAITGSALIDGLLLGKVAFLKAAILANLLLGSSNEAADEGGDYGAPIDSYGAPVDSYGPPAQEYAEPASYDAPAPSYETPSYDAPTYDAPAPSYDAPQYSAPAPAYNAPAPSYNAPTYEEPADTYGAPQADPLPAYGAPAYYKY
jgi:hypothetical protein